MNVIELFAGVGGFRIGVEKVNKKNKVVWSNQWEPSTKKQHASEVYEARFGKEGHSNEDISTVEAKKIPHHDLLCGGFPCFVEGTKVFTKEGHKRIEDIKKGEYVLTHNNRWREVIAPMNQSVDLFVDLKFYGSTTITTTENHPFYVREKIIKNKTIIEEGKKKRKRVYSYSPPEMIPAKDLVENVHYVGVNVNQESEVFSYGYNELSKEGKRLFDKKEEGKIWSEIPTSSGDFWWVVGRYLADGGHVNMDTKARQVQSYIVCNKNECEELENEINKLGLPYQKIEQETVMRFNFNLILLTEFLGRFGRYSHEKLIPVEVQNLPIYLLKKFEDGYLSGDGFVDKKANNLCRITTVSENLALSFQNVIHKIYKLPCRISKNILPSKTLIQGREVNQRDFYSIHYRKVDTRENVLYEEEKLWFPLRKKEKYVKEGTRVYNIEVEEDHTYNVQNIVCKNCQDYSVARPKNLSKGLEGKKGVLWWEIHRIVTEHNTKYLMLENVDRLLISPSKQKGRDFAIILKSLMDLDYVVEWRVVNAAEYGFPQKRRRVFIFAYKKGSKVSDSLYAGKTEVSDLIQSKGIFAQSFPVQSFDREGIKEVDLGAEIFDISDNFNKDSKDKRPFFNAGIAFDNKAYSVHTYPDYKGKHQTLGDMVIPNEDIEEKFFVVEGSEQYEKWVKAKDRIAKERKNPATGETYIFKGGAMPFPDPLTSPARTVITSEGGASASRTTHFVQTEGQYRRLHPIELERLNGFPDDHTKLEGVSDAKRGFLMGNALVVGIVERLAKTLENYR